LEWLGELQKACCTCAILTLTLFKNWMTNCYY
jgi:hypothetical protein